MDEGAKKNLKIGVSAVVLLGAVGYAWSVLKPDPPPIPGQRTFVCVVTGERFELRTEDVFYVPAPNPKTGEETLVPCKMVGDKLVVSSHYRGVVLGEFKDINKYVDPNTLEVLPGPIDGS